MSLNHCGDSNPVTWLRENWDNMIDTVVTLASNVGHEAEENTIGTLSKIEAKDALRTHKGNIWAAVTDCVEQRQLKVYQMTSSVTNKKSPNVYKTGPKMNSLEKLKILIPLRKLPMNVGDLGKLIAATGFEKLPKSNKSPNLVILITSFNLDRKDLK